MKLKVGDKVLVTAGKDKGKKSEVVKVFPKLNKVLVKDINLYTRHIKPMGGNPGQKIKRERPLSVASVAIINDKDQPDRVGYKVMKDGSKVRVFKKTGVEITKPKETKSKNK